MGVYKYTLKTFQQEKRDEKQITSFFVVTSIEDTLENIILSVGKIFFRVLVG